MAGDPPIGTEDAFPKRDPDEISAAQRAQQAEEMSGGPITSTGGADAQDRADAIVRREAGVNTFADADAADRAGEYQIDDYPGQDDPSSAAGMQRQKDSPLHDSPGQAAARGIKDFVQGAEGLVNNDPEPDPRTRR